MKSSKSSTIPDRVPFLWETNQGFWKKNIMSIPDSGITDFKEVKEILQKTSKMHDLSFQNLSYVIEETPKFYTDVFPYIINTLKSSEKLFPDGLKFLKQRKSAKRILSREQVCCIIVNAFFGTFHFFEEFVEDKRRLKWGLNQINFFKLLNFKNTLGKQAKTRMFLNYFERMSQKVPPGKVTFERIHVEKNFSTFVKSTKDLTDVIIHKRGAIEECKGTRQADFANRFIGGSVIGKGCVQEEIRFGINPECTASLIMCPEMEGTESVVIKNTYQFSNYHGYGKTLTYAGNNVDNECGNYEIVAFDALDFRKMSADGQFMERMVQREIWKSYVAFKGGNLDIATGNWGCGVFKGNKELKFIIQWLTCSVNGKKMHYYTFQKKGSKFGDRLEEFVDLVQKKGFKVKDLYGRLIRSHSVAKRMRKKGSFLAEFKKTIK